MARAWLWLLLLSAISAALTTDLLPLATSASGVVLLVLAFFKARIILNDYLGLRQAKSWQRGFTIIIFAYLAGLAALYLAA